MQAPGAGLYRDLDSEIFNAANEFGVSPGLLGTVLEHEGSGRQRVLGLAGFFGLENFARGVEANAPQADSVGVGQIEPGHAVRLGLAKDEGAARASLALSDTFSVRVAAAYLADLSQQQPDADDEALFVSYAFSGDGVDYLSRFDFDPRGVVLAGRPGRLRSGYGAEYPPAVVRAIGRQHRFDELSPRVYSHFEETFLVLSGR